MAALSDLVPLGYGGHGDGHRRRDAARAATQPHPQVAAALPASGATSSKTVGEAWETVEIVGGAALGGQFRSLLDQAPSVTLPDGSTAQLITTRLLNVLVMSDGRLAIGAVTPAALIAAAGSR